MIWMDRLTNCCRLLKSSIDACLQCINSIDRAILNEGLLDELKAFPNIRVFFRHKVQTLDLIKRHMVARNEDNSVDIDVDFNLCIGADGSFSVVRRQMMRVVRSVTWNF